MWAKEIWGYVVEVIILILWACVLYELVNHGDEKK